jgi:hypothetical protein
LSERKILLARAVAGCQTSALLAAVVLAIELLRFESPTALRLRLASVAGGDARGAAPAGSVFHVHLDYVASTLLVFAPIESQDLAG